MANHAQGAPAPAVFSFDTHSVRALDRNGEIWFVAADVCTALGIQSPRYSTRYLDDDEKGVFNEHTPGANQEVIIINESGLYSLILRSRKPEAKRFKKWVTAEVLPAIRKTGQYRNPDLPPSLSEPNHSAELEKAIQRKATELAVANIDLIAEKLANWVDLTRGVQTPQQALERVNRYDPKKAEMVFVPFDVLRSAAGQLRFAQASIDLCAQELQRTQQALGRPFNSQEV